MKVKREIKIYTPEDDPEKIEGFTVVVDVFRAFSTSYYIWENRPQLYLLSDTIEGARDLADKWKPSLLIGERQGIKLEGFDYGNSPTEIIGQDFSEKTIIHTTTAGTIGLLVQPQENEVVVGSFVNLQALINHIEEKKIPVVNIYCTGPKDDPSVMEDYLFADYLKARLQGDTPDFERVVTTLRHHSGQKFIVNPVGPYSDFLYCLDINRFDYLLIRYKTKDGIALRRL